MSLRTLLTSVALVTTLVASPGVARAVEGGTEDRATSHAVAIARGTPGRSAVRCSGTLVSANVVLTVRHCIGGVSEGAKPCDATLDALDAHATDDLWIAASPWADDGAAWKKVASVRVPDSNAICGDDIALLVLRDAVSPSEAVPARPAVDEASFARAIEPRVIGLAAFGVTSPSASDVGIRRSRFDIPLRCVPGRAGFACEADSAFIGDREFTSGNGPCRGDSGGGAIASGDRDVVFGVLSRGESGAGDTTCALGVFERTDRWAWLIARVVLDASSPENPAPPWANEVGASPHADGSEDEAPPASSSCAIGAPTNATSTSVGIVAIQLALLLRRRRGGGLRLGRSGAGGRRR